MIKVCKDNNVLLGVGHERRFENGWQKLKEVVENNLLGNICMLKHILVMIN